MAGVPDGGAGEMIGMALLPRTVRGATGGKPGDSDFDAETRRCGEEPGERSLAGSGGGFVEDPGTSRRERARRKRRTVAYGTEKMGFRGENQETA
jgi:hypothetical protein